MSLTSRTTGRIVHRSLLVAAVAAVTAPLTMFGPAQALDATRVGPADPNNHGFPAYYTDDSGVALQMCDDGTAACLGSGPGALTPPEGENFYWMATTSLSAPGLNLDIEIAAEAAWLSRRAPITFDRLRIRGHSDTAGNILVTTPYGATTVTAEDPAEQRNVNFTEDVGCPGGPCDFGAMTTDPAAHITNWITSTTPPAGRLGDGVSSEPATVGGVPAVASAGGATTNEWVVMGKLANPNAVSLPARVDFGNVRKAATRTIRMKNLGTAPMTINGATLKGDRTLKMKPAASTCKTGLNLGVGRTCTVAVAYKPNGSKRSAATLRIDDSSAAPVRTVRVTALSAPVAKARNQVDFKPVRAGASGPTRRIVVTNTGSLPLKIRGVSLAGRQPGSFDIRNGDPRVCARGTSVPVGKQCAAYVGFEPTGFGQKQASLVIRSNGLQRKVTVSLSGRSR